MTTPHVIASSSPHGHQSSAANVVGTHYKVGKKIGEGSFGVVFEGGDSAIALDRRI
jgi:casein kinase 1